MRNNLLVNVSVANIKRTGIIEAIQIRHVEEAKKTKDGHCLLIDEGKTFNTYEAAGFLFTPEEFQALKQNLTFIRLVFKPRVQQVFLPH